jgi:membrane protease YdiL (CAAX protease family)
MSDLWRRVPVIVRAIIVGGLVSLIGNAPWAILVGVNLKASPTVPWSVVPAALWLWLLWRWLGGWGWPRSSAASRRERLRVAPLSASTWGWALLAGFLGLAAVSAYHLALGRMVAIPTPSLGEIDSLPIPMLAAAIAMTSITAGVVEEAAFRGYMQVPIERRHGPVVAILVVGLAFAAAHFTHGWMGAVLIPTYVLGSVVYGTLAYSTGSILPGVVWHAAGDVISISLLAAGLRRERPLIWESGTDAAFWIEVAIAAACGAAAVALFAKLVRARRRTAAVRAPATQ